MSFEMILNKISLKVNAQYEKDRGMDGLTQIPYFKTDNIEITSNLLENSTQVKQNNDDYLETFFKLKLPFEVKPMKDDKFPGFVMLYAGDEVQHETVVDGYVNRRALHNWIDGNKLFCSYVFYVPQKYGQNYKLQFNTNYGLRTFTLKPAVEFDYSDWPLPEPSLPGLIYKTQPWYAVPQAVAPFEDRTFMVYAPDWEHSLMHMNQTCVNVLRIMRQLCVKFDIPELSEEMLKTVILHELPLDKKVKLGEFLVQMWEKLCQYLKDLKLDHFLVKNFNVFRHIKVEEIEFLQSTAANVLLVLQKCQNEDEKALEKISNNFNIENLY